MRLFSLAAVLIAGTLLFSCNKKGGEGAAAGLPTDKPDTLQERVSYFIGVDIAKNMENQGFEINAERVYQGMKDQLGEDSLKMTQQEMDQVMSDFQAFMQQKASADADSILKAGQAFLEANKEKEGVNVTESGLQYKVLEKGTGPKPDSNDVVKVHYHGTLVDGEVFDSSVDRGTPAQFPVNGVIKGWTEALLKMNVGSKWKIFVPSELAYGSQGAGQGAIQPNEVLIFEVELLEIVDPADQQNPQRPNAEF